MSTIQKLKFERYQTALGTAYKHILEDGRWLVIGRTQLGKGYRAWRLREFAPGITPEVTGRENLLGFGAYGDTKNEMELRATAYADGDQDWWKVTA